MHDGSNSNSSRTDEFWQFRQRALEILGALFSMCTLAVLIYVSATSYNIVFGSHGITFQVPTDHSIMLKPMQMVAKDVQSVTMTAVPKNQNCSMIVMLNTHDSESYIREFVAYYLSQGAAMIYVADTSEHQRVHTELLPFIASGEVNYEHLASAASPAKMAAKFLTHDESNPDRLWLVSISDSEYVTVPGYRNSGAAKEPLGEFLCDKKHLNVQRMPFSWRALREADHGAKLEIERYTAVSSFREKRRSQGKGAFQLKRLSSLSHFDREVMEMLSRWEDLNEDFGFEFLHGYFLNRSEFAREGESIQKDYALAKMAEAVEFHYEHPGMQHQAIDGRRLHVLPPTAEIPAAEKVKIKGGNLVFTSAGNNNDIMSNWVGDGANFDVFVVYYGDDDEKLRQYQATFRWAIRHRGSKMQNFYSVIYKQRPDLIRAAEYFFILDDDIVFQQGVKDINNMFEISRQHNLLISMPSFTKGSVVKHKITANDPKTGLLLKYTNFVEINAPLYSREALVKSLKMYTPKLIGWGIDYLSIFANGLNRTDAYAVIHGIQVLNLEKRASTGKREGENIKNWELRGNIWLNYSRVVHAPYNYKHKNFRSVYEPIVVRPTMKPTSPRVVKGTPTSASIKPASPTTQPTSIMKPTQAGKLNASVVVNGQRFTLNTVTRTWYESNVHCENRGEALALVRDDADNTAIKDLMVKMGSMRAYIGLHENDAGEHRWLNGTSTYLNWNGDEPNNIEEKAVIILGSIYPVEEQGKWADVYSSREEHFVCSTQRL